MIIRRLSRTAACLTLVAAACGGGSDEPTATTRAAAVTTRAPAVTTTGAPATTPAPPPPTTSAPAPTTEVPPPLPTTDPPPNANELLAALNNAMARSGSVLARGLALLSESADFSDPFAMGVVAGGRSAEGDTWLLNSFSFDTPGFTREIAGESRTVDGVSYDQDPVTGVWSVDPEDEPDPFDAAFDGELDLSGVSVEFAEDGYILRGEYTTTDTVYTIDVAVDAFDNRLVAMRAIWREPREDIADLIGADGEDVYLSQTIDVERYDTPVAAVLAPPEGLITVIRPEPFGDMTLQVPGDWEGLSPDEIARAGVTDGLVSPAGDLALLILIENIVPLGVETLEAYVALIRDLVLVDFDVTTSEETTTIQGERAWLLGGTFLEDGTPFRRFLYLSGEGIAFNASFVGDPVTSEDNLELISFLLNTFRAFP